MKIYSIVAIGNFWGGRCSEQGMDLFFVAANSPSQAKEIAEHNVETITEMFKNKILYKGKKRALRKSEKNLIKIGAREPKPSCMNGYNKVLTEKGIFEEVTL